MPSLSPDIVQNIRYIANIPHVAADCDSDEPVSQTSVRKELIAICGALYHALNSYKDSIWILTDSRSSIQYLKNWPKIMDGAGLDILSKLARLGQRKQVCLQWIPSHVGVLGNEAVDELAELKKINIDSIIRVWLILNTSLTIEITRSITIDLISGLMKRHLLSFLDRIELTGQMEHVW
ncbi:RNase H domain-containing protein [Trichonephila clavipes]|nr:RNase H domain-containing protein [Trichonephila clavipes]